jgi:hypothetical protein
MRINREKALFLKFDTQENRRKYGGSCFIELQFCKLPSGTKIKHILESLDHWKDDSLYVYDDKQSEFYIKYKDVIGFGIHPNMSEGYFDTWGVTYYGLNRIRDIKERLKEHKPEENEVLLSYFAI